MKQKLLSSLIVIICLSTQLSLAQNSIVGNLSIKTPTSINVGDIKCMQKIGDYLYTGYWGSSDIKVFDISTPGSPVLVNTQSIETPFTGSCSLLGMTTANGFLYVVSRYTDKLYIIDVSDPLNLIVTGTLAIPTNNNDIIVDGNFAYISTIDSGGPLTIVDISNPAAPVSVSSTSLGSGTGPYSCYEIAKLGDFVYVNYYNNGGLDIKVVNVSIPSVPVVVNTLTVPGNTIYGDLNITGNVLYFSYSNNSTEYLRAYDLTTPSTPVFAKDIVLSGRANSLNYDGQYLYAGCNTAISPIQTPGALTVIDISTPLNPTIIAQSEASYTDPSEDVFVVAGWAYVADNLYDKLVTFPINCVGDSIVSIIDVELCPSNTGTTVTIPTSELYANYYLRDNTNDTIIDGPYIGDGNLITFNTGVISTDMTYNVYADLSQYNNTLNFDGTNDYVILPNETDYDFTTNMTVEFMINTTDLQSVDGLVTKGDNSWRIHGGVTTGKISFAGNGAFSDFESTTSVDDGIWHHVAVTYDGVIAKIYIDGNLENSVPATNSISNSAFAVALGENMQATNRYFNGSMDEVRIWNIAKSATEINAFRGVELQGTETGLVSYYNFNQGVSGGVNSSETIALDIAVSGNNGTLNNFALTGLTSNWIENNAVNCQFELSTMVSVVIDNTLPVADVTTLADVSETCQVATLTAPTATDNCSGSITGTTTTPFPITTQGTTVVTWTYDDGNGNTSTQTQNVIINDVTAPVADVTTLADVSETCQVATLTAPTATDNCSATVTVTNDATLPITMVGTTVVTWTYDDGNGNIDTQTQNVIVLDPNIDVTTTTTNFVITSNNTSATATYQWIDCGNANAPISGATSASYTATANGDYAVVVTEGNCSDTSACVLIAGVGIGELAELGVSIFPNPNNGEFTISTIEKNVNITVYSVDGKIIVNNLKVIEANQLINLGDLESGIYFVRVTNNINQKTIRLVVE